MEKNPNDLVHILFSVLFGFVLLNIILNSALLVINKRRIYKLLFSFWLSVLFSFFVHSMIQNDLYSIGMAYSVTFIPMTIFSMIGFEILGRRFPLSNYIVLYTVTIALSLLFFHRGFNFTISTLPMALGTAAPLLHSAIYINFIDRKKTTYLQKVLGIVFFVAVIHCLNFSFFRMDASTQIWGWFVGYAIYDALAVILPTIALEIANLTENQRLNDLIKERTSELEQSLKENQGLIKILIHDVSGPLMSLRLFMKAAKQSPAIEPAMMDRMSLSVDSLNEIVSQTNARYRQKGAPLALKPTSLIECFNDVADIYNEPLKAKNIHLKFDNQLAPGTMVMAEKISFTHSVLSNLISNALKFTKPNSTITVIAKEDDHNQVSIKVIDQGPGISPKIVNDLFGDSIITSTTGSNGEKGFGFGLSIVKSVVDNYGGKLDFSSVESGSEVIGAQVQVTLAKAPISSHIQ